MRRVRFPKRRSPSSLRIRWPTVGAVSGTLAAGCAPDRELVDHGGPSGVRSQSWTHPAEIPFTTGALSAPAIKDGHRDLTYGDLAEEVLGIAGGLDRLGIERGHVIAVMLPNRVELATTMLAAWQLGAAVTPINPALPDDEVHHQLVDSGSNLVVVDGEGRSRVASAGKPVLRVEDIPGLIGDTPPIDLRLNDVALVAYTSGTTSQAKGVIIDHANVAAMLEMHAAGLELSSEDRALVALSLCQVSELLLGVCGTMATGGSSVILDHFTPARFFEHVVRYRPTVVSLMPEICELLTRAVPDLRPDLSSIRLCFVGGAKIPPEVVEQFARHVGVEAFEEYRLLECTGVCTRNLPGRRKVGSVGRAFPGCRLRIVDADGARVPSGKRGEVLVRGENVMRRYLNPCRTQPDGLSNGWLHTGDIGYVDEDGYLFLVDRKQDLIACADQLIYPTEIEAALKNHPAVCDAAVIGRHDQTYGQALIAFVQARVGHTLDTTDLEKVAEAQLAEYQRPFSYHVVDAFPRSASGAIRKPVLRASLYLR